MNHRWFRETDGIRATIAYHRHWLTGLFPSILGERCDRDLTAALVQLIDGAVSAAHLDRDRVAARRARATADLLLETIELEAPQRNSRRSTQN
ncbi:hypothetical protein APR12_002462 [Nocardia amikacinitolerans]|nr:hypothetical protein [Nocardia amikacinitolerans]